MHRGVFTATLPEGDYVLRTTGVSWNVDRATAAGSVLQLLAGEHSRKNALERMLALARNDGTDAWEAWGARSYRLIRRHRASA
jgi:hypothetical protein